MKKILKPFKIIGHVVVTAGTLVYFVGWSIYRTITNQEVF